MNWAVCARVSRCSGLGFLLKSNRSNRRPHDRACSGSPLSLEGPFGLTALSLDEKRRLGCGSPGKNRLFSHRARSRNEGCGIEPLASTGKSFIHPAWNNPRYAWCITVLPPFFAARKSWKPLCKNKFSSFGYLGA